MSRIKQLSPLEIQRIAAGEVIERPANVVKELVENSIDAGASSISIYIEQSGKQLIRVADNGYGMSHEDALLCFKHHTTSKISRVDDLHSLNTFGFRGEALSSISSVSAITLTTKEDSTDQATQLMLEQGMLIKEQAISANTGTDIAIANLFFNVPARKKFLKTDDTEWRQIQLLFQAFCLDYLSIHFKLYHNGADVFNCPPASNVQQRIAQLWDHTIASQAIAVQTTAAGITIEGALTNHTYARYDRSAIFFFVNKRWVKNHTLAKALMKGYLNVLQPDKFPLAALAITIDPAQIDVNIHPRKEEIQFLHPRLVENAIQEMTKKALEENLSAQLKQKVSFNPSPQPSLLRSRGGQGSTPQQEWFDSPNKVRHSPRMVEINHSTNQPVRIDGEKTFPYADLSLEPNPNANIPIFENQIHSDTESNEYHIIGQFHKTYILIEQDESLFLIDQHAAHERILYEQFCVRFEDVATTQLLFPQIISLASADMQLLEDHKDIFVHNNIAIEPFGTNQVVITAIPMHLKEIDLNELVHQTVGWIIEHQRLDKDLFYKQVNEKLHAQMACKAAVKAGDVLTIAQMEQLVRDLEKIENRFTCPHGRPTGWKIPLYDIEKKFKRKL